MENDRLLWKAGALSRAGRHCDDLKLRVCYRNRAFEFVRGGEEMLALMKETDSDLVHFIIDAGDAMRAKADVAAFFTKYHRRIDGLHLRDFNKQDVQVTLGRGEMQYEPLEIAVRKLRWTGWVIAEEDRANGEKPGEGAARPAREQIRKLFGA
jgi:sugar phosphate isomerase/epimerase